jgi:sigma-E factor negative regulatory protein RseC
MIEQQGKVVALNNGKACVRLGGVKGCLKCDEGKGCGAGIFGRLVKRKPIVLELENELDASPGQAVMVGIPEIQFLGLVGRLYFMPLMLGLLGAVLGFMLCQALNLGAAAADILTLSGAIVFGGAAVYWNRNVSREFPEVIIVHLLRIL